MIHSSSDPTDWSRLEAEDAAEAARAQADEARVKRGFWHKIRRTAASVPFAEDAVAAYFAAFDRNTPLKVRAGLMAALAYFVLPADFAPDILPVIGFGDDAAVLFTALKLLSSHITPTHRDAAHEALEDLKSGR